MKWLKLSLSIFIFHCEKKELFYVDTWENWKKMETHHSEKAVIFHYLKIDLPKKQARLLLVGRRTDFALKTPIYIYVQINQSRPTLIRGSAHNRFYRSMLQQLLGQGS